MAKLNPNLHDVTMIKNMAAAIATSDTKGEQGDALAQSYERARQRAKELVARSWPEDADRFDEEVPPITATRSARTLPRGMQGMQPLVDSQARGQAAVVLAAQLEAWVCGHQEAFEIEFRLEAEAEAKNAAAASKRPTGFQ